MRNLMDFNAEGLPEIFQSWEIADPEDEGLSYGITGGEQEPYSIWVSELPADPEVAWQALDRQGAYLDQASSAVDSAPLRAERLVQSVRAATVGEEGGVSFDAIQGEARPAPEMEALNILSALEGEGTGVAYGLFDSAGEVVKAAEDRFRQAVEQALRLASHQAWVETRTGGDPVGLTIVGWNGDLHTVWSDRPDPEKSRLHQRSVSQALQARAVQIHAVVVATQSAAKLGVLLSNPAGAILALPAGWKLVEQILADIDKYRKIKSQETEDAERI